jgi:hypothetical protein
MSDYPYTNDDFGYEDEYAFGSEPMQEQITTKTTSTKTVGPPSTTHWIWILLGTIIGLLLLWWLYRTFIATPAPSTTSMQPSTPSSTGTGTGTGTSGGTTGPVVTGTTQLSAAATPSDVIAALAKRGTHLGGTPFSSHEDFIIKTPFLNWQAPSTGTSTQPGTVYTAQNTGSSSPRTYALVYKDGQWDLIETTYL